MPAPSTTTPRSVEAMRNCSTMHVRKRSTIVRSTAVDIDNLEKLKKRSRLGERNMGDLFAKITMPHVRFRTVLYQFAPTTQLVIPVHHILQVIVPICSPITSLSPLLHYLYKGKKFVGELNLDCSDPFI
jgi:hypothetical protein